MKKLALMFFISIMFFSCKKEYLIPDKEVPDWLKAEIKHEEQVIKESPQLMNAYGGWLRYDWQNEYYFEYHNTLSSSSPIAISTKGETLHIWANDVTTDYYKEKCCKTLVWEAPNFSDIPDK